MKRRDFTRKGFGAAAFTGLALSTGYSSKLFGNSALPEDPFDLVAVKGGEPNLMFDKAIASLGGMKTYVKAGQSVLVKPNIGWDAIPERAANTNPKLIGRIVQHCFEAGANGESLKTTKVHELVMSSDVFINVPVLKSHSSAKLTIAMKNLMGVVWDRMWWHRNDLQQCIADFVTFRKPDLNIIDAYNVMMKNGPRGVSEADVSNMKSLIMSPDIVAADAAAAKLFGHDPDEIPHIEIADQMEIGTMDLSQLNINRIIL